MPCGPELINAVAAVLDPEKPRTCTQIQALLVGHYSPRAIRYAMKELVDAGRAVRRGAYRNLGICAVAVNEPASQSA